MTKNDDEPAPLFAASSQPLFDEHRAYALILSFGNDSHRRQSDACQFPFICFNRNRAEEDMADDQALVVGHQRYGRLVVPSKRVNKVSLCCASERLLVDDSD